MNSLKIALRGRNLNVTQVSHRPIATGNVFRSGRKIFDDDDEKTRQAKKDIADLKEKEVFAEYEQDTKGSVYAKQPFKYPCIQGKAYIWCSCGRSHKQPFCDGTHKNVHLKIKNRPIRWDCKESKDYWFCNCKQTQHPPFCDGTHKAEWIQKFDSTIRDYNSPPIDPILFKKKK